MVGEVVVVFDGLEGGGLAEETEVVDGDGDGEEGLQCYSEMFNTNCFALHWAWKEGETYHQPWKDRNAKLEREILKLGKWRWWCIRSLDVSCPISCMLDGNGMVKRG